MNISSLRRKYLSHASCIVCVVQSIVHVIQCTVKCADSTFGLTSVMKLYPTGQIIGTIACHRYTILISSSSGNVFAYWESQMVADRVRRLNVQPNMTIFSSSERRSMIITYCLCIIQLEFFLANLDRSSPSRCEPDL